MERRSPDWRGCWGAGREVVFSEIHQEWLVLMQEENSLLRKADEEQEHSGRGRSNRKNKTQDGRRLRRYRRRWKIERLFAWLQNFRRLITRHERHAENFLGFLQLGCICILLRH